MSSSDSAAAFAAAIIGLVLYVVVAVICIIVMWRLYRKASKPGWAAIVPVYNYVVLLEIIGRPIWWILLTFIPIVNIYVALVVALDLAKSFGKSTAFGIGNFLVPFITYPILAFSKNARYSGPIAEGLDSFAPAPDRPMTPPQTNVEGQPLAPTMTEVSQQPATPTPTGQPAPLATPPEAPSEPNQPRPPQF
ncbi:MAG TPA: DUF5684 domain-containing protein [Patescibacteria group bacterium]|nr:DUF5684 domain-containing protein [Patescibacteria group bacterium]